MKVLLTGAGGFLGGAVWRTLRARSELEVIPVFRRSRGVPGEVVADLTDRALDRLLPAQVDLVIHAGAYVPERESLADRDLAMANNTEATLRLLEYSAAAGVKRFVHVSSAAVYGVPLVPGAVSEAVEPRPDNAYALSKLAAEFFLEPYRFVRGIETVGLRFSYIYGPGMRESSVVRKFAAMARDHRPITLVNGGADFFDLVHVSDAVSAVESAMQRGSGIYNIGSGRPTSVLQLATAMVEVHRSRSEIEKLPAPGKYHSKYLDVTKAASELGWHAKITLQQGLAEW